MFLFSFLFHCFCFCLLQALLVFIRRCRPDHRIFPNVTNPLPSFIFLSIFLDPSSIISILLILVRFLVSLEIVFKLPSCVGSTKCVLFFLLRAIILQILHSSISKGIVWFNLQFKHSQAILKPQANLLLLLFLPPFVNCILTSSILLSLLLFSAPFHLLHCIPSL